MTAPLRADARRNRDLIVAAAADAFAQHGPDVPVEEIAKAAGVGVGTVYRRFPDRAALMRGVGLSNLAQAVAEAEAAAAEEPTPWDALVRILQQSKHLRRSLQMSLTLPLTLMNDPEAIALKRRMMDVMDDVLRAGQADGSIRSDVGTGDVALAFVLLAKQLTTPRLADAPRAAERCLALMLDALRNGPSEPLPGAPITRADLGL